MLVPQWNENLAIGFFACRISLKKQTLLLKKRMEWIRNNGFLCWWEFYGGACDCLILVRAGEDQLYGGWLHYCEGAFEVAVGVGCGGSVDYAAVCCVNNSYC